MIQSRYSSLTIYEATDNMIKLTAHYDVNEKKTEYGFGVWCWGRHFFRIDNKEKKFYKIMFRILERVGIIKTEKNDPALFNELKEASYIKFAVLTKGDRQILEDVVDKQRSRILELEEQVKASEGQREKALEALDQRIKDHQELAHEHDKHKTANSEIENRINQAAAKEDEYLKINLKLHQTNETLKTESQKFQAEVNEWKHKHHETHNLLNKAVEGLHKLVKWHEDGHSKRPLLTHKLVSTAHSDSKN